MSGQNPTSGGDEPGDDGLPAALDRFGATLRGSAVWDQPPFDLADRIVAEIAALQAGGAGAGPAAGHGAGPVSGPPAPMSLDTARRRRYTWARPALAAAAVAVLAFAGGLLVGGGDDEKAADPVAELELVPTEMAAGASAAGTVVNSGAGYSISLAVAGLPPAPDGGYYEGWLHNEETDDWVSIGTFHMRSGDADVVLWSGVPISRYAQLVVTAEVEGSRGGHGEILLQGPVVRV